MKSFDQLCKEFETLDPISYGVILTEKSMRVLPALAEISADGLTGSAIFSTFVLGAVAADGKLTEEEYALTEPLFKLFFGENVRFEDCRAVIRAMRRESKELKKAVDEMVDLFGLISEDLKAEIILVCMMICAIDGKISLAEKLWIKQLIK